MSEINEAVAFILFLILLIVIYQLYFIISIFVILIEICFELRILVPTWNIFHHQISPVLFIIYNIFADDRPNNIIALA